MRVSVSVGGTGVSVGVSVGGTGVSVGVSVEVFVGVTKGLLWGEGVEVQ